MRSFTPLYPWPHPSNTPTTSRSARPKWKCRPPDSANRDEDYDRKLKDAQEELDRIQLQREELERKKSELEELTIRKRAFLSQQVELTEKLTSVAHPDRPRSV